ncbi:MAG: hypothetical protein KAJ07_11785 [Planctomycetes bacterium]|nr:hypothetical protein [Planctomycetota bacterium]
MYKEYHARRITVRKGVWNDGDVLQYAAKPMSEEVSAASTFREICDIRIFCVDSLTFFLAEITMLEAAVVSLQWPWSADEWIAGAANLSWLPVSVVSGHGQ